MLILSSGIRRRVWQTGSSSPQLSEIINFLHFECYKEVIDYFNIIFIS
jgi:hypothetical protein